MCKGIQRVSLQDYYYVLRRFFSSAPDELKKKRGHLNSSDDKLVVNVLAFIFHNPMAPFQSAISTNRDYTKCTCVRFLFQIIRAILQCAPTCAINRRFPSCTKSRVAGPTR